MFIVETIDSAKKADTLNKACVNVGRQNKLKVYVQVNTSGEDCNVRIYQVLVCANHFVIAKSGVEPQDALDVCKHIKENCPALEIYGLMTIGMKGRDASNNPDFDVSTYLYSLSLSIPILRIFDVRKLSNFVKILSKN